MVKPPRTSAAEKAEPLSLVSAIGFAKTEPFSASLHLQETDELYIVSQFFVEEWRKFVR